MTDPHPPSPADALSPAQRRALAAVLDALIPPSPERGLPGAGEIGLATHVEEIAELRDVVRQGLAGLDEAATRRGAAFEALAPPDRAAALSELAAAQPAFLPGLIFQTYAAYYQDARVLEALGLEGRPPHPQGYPLEPGDLTLLERVRQRERMYREC